jgi:isopentenyl-diphosphate delta-isomerase
MERLSYEMGIDCNLEFLFSFIYKARVENNLTEHEFDHVFLGTTSSQPHPNILEVQAYKWMKPEIVLKNLIVNPEQYTVWFRKILQRVLEEKQNISKHQ